MSTDLEIVSFLNNFLIWNSLYSYVRKLSAAAAKLPYLYISFILRKRTCIYYLINEKGSSNFFIGNVAEFCGDVFTAAKLSFEWGK